MLDRRFDLINFPILIIFNQLIISKYLDSGDVASVAWDIGGD